MARDDHWFKCFYRQLLIATQGWPDDKFGAYWRLLIHQFDRDGLPSDEEELKTLITTFKKNWPALSKKFPVCEDGFLRNEFMAEIREERDLKKAKNTTIGKYGGRPKKNQTVSENKPNGYKNKTHIDNISLSTSYSDSSLEEESPKEETHKGVKSGFFCNELPVDQKLSEMQVGTTLEFIRIKTGKQLTEIEIEDHWKAFKINNFPQKKWYNDFADLIQHFRNSLKNEIHATHSKTNSGGLKGGKLGTSEARIAAIKNW